MCNELIKKEKQTCQGWRETYAAQLLLGPEGFSVICWCWGIVQSTSEAKSMKGLTMPQVMRVLIGYIRKKVERIFDLVPFFFASI